MCSNHRVHTTATVSNHFQPFLTGQLAPILSPPHPILVDAHVDDLKSEHIGLLLSTLPLLHLPDKAPHGEIVEEVLVPARASSNRHSPISPVDQKLAGDHMGPIAPVLSLYCIPESHRLLLGQLLGADGLIAHRHWEAWHGT